MNLRAQQACAVAPIGVILLFFAGLSLAGFIVPPDPAASAEEIARIYGENRELKRAGFILEMFGAGLLVPFGVSIFMQLKRAGADRSPLPWVWLMGSALLSLEFIYLDFFWLAGTFREDYEPETLRLLNDVAWIPFVGLTSTAVIMTAAYGWSILADRSGSQDLPRWLGYFNLWIATMFTPGTLCVFFKDGPLAWDGLLAWWLPVTAFTVWSFVNSIVILRRLPEQARFDVLAAQSAAREALDLHALGVRVEELQRRLDNSGVGSS